LAPRWNVEAVGEEGWCDDEKGFLSGGTGGAGPAAPDLKAFLMDANDPFRFARNPADEEMDVPGVTSEDEDPLLSLTSFGRSSDVPGAKLAELFGNPGRGGLGPSLEG